MIPLVPVTRPNGKVYRPRKVSAHHWSNQEVGYSDDRGVVILGTQDFEACREFATRMAQYWDLGTVVDNPRVGWFRDGYQYGNRWWVDDTERGAAGVIWEAFDQ